MCVDDPTSHHECDRLLADLAAGREDAFARLYDQFGARLYRAALGLVGRRDEAEDAVQEVFLALLRSRSRLAGVRDLAAYLFASLRRAVSRRVVTRLRGHAHLEDAGGHPASEPAREDPRSEALRRALQMLSPEQREVITLKIDGELTFAQIAGVLEISANTAASRYRYALERLRELLKES